MNPKQEREFLKTIGRLFDGTATDAERLQFSERLAWDAAARAFYMDFVLFDFELEWLCGKRPSQESLGKGLARCDDAALPFQWLPAETPPIGSDRSTGADTALGVGDFGRCPSDDRTPLGGADSSNARGQPVPDAASDSPQAVSQSPVLGFLGTAASLSGSWLSSPKVLALTVVGCLATYFIGLMISIVISRGLWSRHNLAQNVESPAFTAARIISAEDCSWADPLPGANHSAELPAGVSRLTGGTVEIEFDGGARLRIEGPAEFTPQSAGRLELNQGRLTAYVPRRARGFTVGTPTAEVVDLGTEFSLAVEADGQTEVHVVRGLVDVKPSAPPSDPKPSSATRLGAGSAVRIVPGQSVARIPFDGDRFKSLPGTAASHAGGHAQQQRLGTRDKRFLQGSVQVLNGSFEVPAIRDNPAAAGSLTSDLSDSGWQLTGAAGLLETTLGQPSDGSQALFVGTGPFPASVYQHVGALSPNTEYTLTVDVCPRAEADDKLAGSTGFIALVEGTDDTGTVLAKNTSIVQPSRAAGVQTCSVCFSTDTAARGPLTVVLAHEGTDNPADMQVVFDNVRLTAVRATEPVLDQRVKSGDVKLNPRAGQPAAGRAPQK